MRLLPALVALVLVVAEGSCGDPDAVWPGRDPAPPPSDIEFILEVESSPSDRHVVVTLDVVDRTGLPAVNLETTEVYPTKHIQRTPYRHWVVRPPHVPISVSVEALMAGEEGDLLTCAIYVNGRKSTDTPGGVHVAQVEAGSAHVLCQVTKYD